MKKDNMKKELIIYRVSNKSNNYVYIGATTKSIEERKKDHFYKSSNSYERKFYKALNNYGVDAFTWEQIDTANNLNELAKKEREYIVEYNSQEKGYNSDSGGGFSKYVYKYSKEGEFLAKYDSLDKAALTVSSKKQQISRACLTSREYADYVWSYSDSFDKIEIKDGRTKKVFQYSLENEFISEYNSVSEASKDTGCNETSIAKVCRGERNKCGGFKWRYK